MRTLMTIAVSLLVLNGCTATTEPGQGEYFEVTNLHVVERDLSQFKPATVTSTTTKNAPRAPKKVQIINRYDVRENESYRSAIQRWVRSDGYTSVAWGMDATHQEILLKTQFSPLSYQGSLKQALDKLSKELDTPIHLTVDKKKKVAGIYDFKATPRIVHVKGNSLKQVVSSVVSHYGYKWVDGEALSRSWLAPNDYQFGSDYFLITRADDMNSALEIILEGYPVYSSILQSTGQVFVQEGI